MFKTLSLLAAVVLAWGTASADVELGKKVEKFKLKDYNGKDHALSDYKGKKAVVLMFIATRCPVSNAYNERMARLDADYRDKGVQFIGINSNKQEPAEEVAKHAGENEFKFPVLKDPDNVVADRFRASVTPEIYVIDSKGVLRYHGYIDDDQYQKKEKSSQDLRTALDALLKGDPVSVERTKAFGCTIKRVSKS
ncbi:MAG: thioredoxin family protein [Candidatus Latescibacteria bacterium]|nr:thioredoxin family protein [Candidatus Latescibacterota bacterium]